MEPALWLLTGAAAGIADYGLGLGFGLAASIILATLLGYDPRGVAAAAAAAQVATTLPALVAHNRRGNIDHRRAKSSLHLLLVLSASATLSATLTSYAAALLPRSTVTLLYTAALTALLPLLAAAGASKARASLQQRPGIVAAAAGLLAGFEKAIVGGGFSVVIAAAQVAIGIDLRTAIALTPALKLPAFMVVTAVYGLHGYLDPMAAAALTLGALLTLPLSTRLLKAARTRHLAAVMATTLILSVALNTARLVHPHPPGQG